VLLGRLWRRRDRDGVADGGGARLGRYELLYPLGVGGMAEIYKARALGPAGYARDVVIKRILPAHGDDLDFVRMFEAEANILGRLHHPNVVEVYDFGRDGGLPYLALEYVDGPSLSRVLRTLRAANRMMPAGIAAFVGREISRALDYVHNLEDASGSRLDVIHRDVTPSNIVLAATGGVKLLDFGVATFRTAGQISKSGTVKGKPAYLAPEQLEGKPLDGRVDLFALGIVMHEMLSLQHLFAGDSDLGTVKKLMEMEIPSPAARRDDVPPALEAIVMRALERDRRRRFASASEMSQALDDFVVASKLHVEEVVAFVRGIDRPTRVASLGPVAAPAAIARRVRARRAAAATTSASDRIPTVKEGPLALQVKNTARAIAAAPRAALLVGVALVAVGVGTALGLRGHNQARAREGDAHALTAPSRALTAPSRAEAQAGPPGPSDSTPHRGIARTIKGER
jgi:serine/threonine-protein kinase